MNVEEIPVATCPFCGSKNCSPNANAHYMWTDCDDCGAKGPRLNRTKYAVLGTDEHVLDLNAAVTIWNKRA